MTDYSTRSPSSLVLRLGSPTTLVIASGTEYSVLWNASKPVRFLSCLGRLPGDQALKKAGQQFGLCRQGFAGS